MSAAVNIPKKPPSYWLAAKRAEGLSDAAAGRIWYRIYDDEKRLLAWMVASESEWQVHGVRKPV
jgi:hypothetical protein